MTQSADSSLNLHYIVYTHWVDTLCRALRIIHTANTSGPRCSKLTMSLVNASLELLILNTAYMLIFLLKKCDLQNYSHFFSKYTCDLYIVLTINRTVNILTTNELVKLTMLCTAGPWKINRNILMLDYNFIKPVVTGFTRENGACSFFRGSIHIMTVY